MNRIETPSAGVYVEKSIVILEHLLKALQNDEKMKGRLGCVLNLASPKGVPLLLLTVGIVSDEKHPAYCRFAQEKAARLALLAQYAGHSLSRQSADEKLERYPGAVLGHHFIHSTSAFPADVDEMYSAAQAVAMNDLTMAEARIMIQQTNNKYFERLKFLLHLAW